jgi:hypothetical protein
MRDGENWIAIPRSGVLQAICDRASDAPDIFLEPRARPLPPISKLSELTPRTFYISGGEVKERDRGVGRVIGFRDDTEYVDEDDR